MSQRTPNRDSACDATMLWHAWLDLVVGFSRGTPSPQQNNSLSYLSPLPICSHSLCPSILSLLNPSLACPLCIVAAQLKICSPICVSPRSEGSAYHAVLVSLGLCPHLMLRSTTVPSSTASQPPPLVPAGLGSINLPNLHSPAMKILPHRIRNTSH